MKNFFREKFQRTSNSNSQNRFAILQEETDNLSNLVKTSKPSSKGTNLKWIGKTFVPITLRAPGGVW